MLSHPTPESSGGIRQVVRLVTQGSRPLGGGAALSSRAFPEFRSAGPFADLAELSLAGINPPVLGAMATLAELAADHVVREQWPALAEAAAATATPGVRLLATIGGTVAARLPGCDLAAALDVHETEVVMEDVLGQRRLPFGDYWTHCDLGPHLVVGVVLGRPSPGCYRRVAARRGPAPAIATLAAVRRPDGSVDLRAGAVADRPVPVDAKTLSVADDVVLRSDDRASAGQRARLLRSLAAEALEALQ